MKYVEKVLTKKFECENKKDAYLKACKWMASNVLKYKRDNDEFTFEITEMKSDVSFIFRLTVYVVLDEEQLFEGHCDVCRQINYSFYKDSEACSQCRAKAYRYRMQEKIAIKKNYALEQLKGIVSE